MQFRYYRVLSDSNNIYYDVYTLKNGLISVVDYDNGEEVHSITYNSNNELTSDEEVDYPDGYSLNYSWNNGLLTIEYGVVYLSNQSSTYEYNRTISLEPSCITFLNTLFFFGSGSDVIFYNYWGKIPAYPLSKCYTEYYDGWYDNYNNYHNSISTSTTTYTYSNIDDNGCPGKVTETYGSSVTTYTLTWKQL